MERAASFIFLPYRLKEPVNNLIVIKTNLGSVPLDRGTTSREPNNPYAGVLDDSIRLVKMQAFCQLDLLFPLKGELRLLSLKDDKLIMHHFDTLD